MGSQTDIPDWIRRLFADIDRAGVEGIKDRLHEQVAFRFGSFPAGAGRDNFAALWAQLSPLVESLHHELLEAWELEDRSVCRGNVTYRRVQGGPATFPFCNVFRRRDGRIVEYLIYVDASPVFGVPPVSGS
ncbi:MAG: nuclear transport factor 2 family protein [Xanthomonadales bacterium]|nr:nuclear transport factor 2 family protein [Xanthomonadales bacterium]